MTINDKRKSEDDKIIKQQNGKSRCFAFVTRDSGEGAQAAIDKFHSHFEDVTTGQRFRAEGVEEDLGKLWKGP
ncbi:hypothetical protein DVH24_015597 [Malus domestica]|uniref:RRM domain-containing protein n=1 Tax=Malus domestica TaxID=3750 RepID=A0A498HN43_MALDO|nr:hypothetical protein DVH24_015597 [Malus domestica]